MLERKEYTVSLRSVVNCAELDRPKRTTRVDPVEKSSTPAEIRQEYAEIEGEEVCPEGQARLQGLVDEATEGREMPAE